MATTRIIFYPKALVHSHASNNIKKVTTGYTPRAIISEIISVVLNYDANSHIFLLLTEQMIILKKQ